MWDAARIFAINGSMSRKMEVATRYTNHTETSDIKDKFLCLMGVGVELEESPVGEA